MSIYPQSNSDLNGIISNFYYTDKENFFNIVSIDGSKVNSDGWSEKEVIINPELTDNSMSNAWCSEDEPNVYIALHFKKHYIHITNYTIKTRTYTAHDLPTGWVLYGSINNEKWILIDQKIGITELNTINIAKTYEATYPGTYKHFKLIQTSNTWNRYYFCLEKFEIFGEVKQKLSNQISHFYKLQHFSHIALIIIML